MTTGTLAISRHEILVLVRDLAEDLATEIELNYEPLDYPFLTPSMSLLRRAEEMLEESGMEVPSVVRKVLSDLLSQEH